MSRKFNTRILLGLVAMATLVAGATTQIAASAAPFRTPASGAYLTSPARGTSFGAATQSQISMANDSLPLSSGWAGMDGANGSLSWFLQKSWTGSGYALLLDVPVIPTSNGAAVGTLANGALGAYNAYFVTLAKTLVAGGESHAYLRLGWEFDGSWFAWGATTSTAEANFAAYFRQIVAAMRGVQGQNFKFVWSLDATAFITRGYNPALAYPGNAYVNYVGVDAYDQSWNLPLNPTHAWSSTVLPSLTAAQHFAASQGEPLAITEWGVAIRADGHGLGDDPLYVSNMISWMKNPTNNVAFESYFNYNGLPRGIDSQITGGYFPKSLAAFIAGMR